MQELIKILPARISIEMCLVLGYEIAIKDGNITVERKRERWKRK